MSSVTIRHEQIIRLLKASGEPVSGTSLASHFNVSRQIIVHDINTLKSQGHQIISTAKGYILLPSNEVIRIFKVQHDVSEVEKELNLIVDLGAEIRDVFIFHRVYGEIHGPLNIASRRDVTEFCNDIKSGKSSPLSTATAGYHYHTIVAKDDETLDLVEKELQKAGFLAPLTDYEPDSIRKIQTEDLI